MPDSDTFASLTDPYRSELLAHCYRMLGSVHDAEDLVQETYLRAWRYYDGFEGRASLRTWLYRIATSACLRALENRSRRPLPSGLGGPSDDPEAPLVPSRTEVAWLEPIPDALLGATPDDPAAIVASRGSIRLAFVAALQHLPARQRAVLILRDVLAWRATEVADLLGTTTTAVNSTLRRARAQLVLAAPAEEEVDEPAEPERRAQVDRYVAAFETADLDALLRLLREDVVVEMPPFPAWFAGREAVARFFTTRLVLEAPGRRRMLLTGANGQPAAAMYLRDRDGVHRPHSVQVLTVTGGGISRIVAFLDANLFATFGLPPSYDAEAGMASVR